MKTESVIDQADRESELPRLLWVLRHGKGFGLYFVCCNALAYRRELVEKIKAEYAQPILEFDLTGHDGEAYIDHRLLTWAEDKTPGAPVFCYGLETLLPTRDEDRQFRTLQEINWRRNVYSQLNRNLVIWLPEYALNLLARTASDFYDWHTAVFEFPVPDSEKSHLIGQSMLGFMEGETHAANRMTLEEKKRWLSVLNGLLDETPKDTVEYARLLYDRGRLFRSFAKYEDALNDHLQCLTIYQSLDDKKCISMALNDISRIYRIIGDYDKALYYIDIALAVANEMGNHLEEQLTLNNIGRLYFSMGDYDKALAIFEKALDYRQLTGDRATEAATLDNIALIYIKKGLYEKSLEYLREVLSICREIGHRALEASAINNMSRIYLALGNYIKALAFAEDAQKIQQEIGHLAGLCRSLSNKGMIYFKQGNLTEAEFAWLQAFRIAKEIGLAETLQELEKYANDLGNNGLKFWESKV